MTSIRSRRTILRRASAMSLPRLLWLLRLAWFVEGSGIGHCAIVESSGPMIINQKLEWQTRLYPDPSRKYLIKKRNASEFLGKAQTGKEELLCCFFIHGLNSLIWPQLRHHMPFGLWEGDLFTFIKHHHV